MRVRGGVRWAVFIGVLSTASVAVAAEEHKDAAKAEAAQSAAPAKSEQAPEQAPQSTPEELFKAGQKAIVDGDLIAAMPLFKKAADAGYAPAQVSVADLFLTSDYFTEAADFYRKAAEQGNADGQFGLASVYVEGKGVGKDAKLALDWYTKAAEQNHVQAIDALAAAYANGGLGLSAEERNSDKSFHWIEAAAKHDNLLAMRALAYAYRTGAFGASVSVAQAETWDEKIKVIEAKFQKKRKKDKQ